MPSCTAQGRASRAPGAGGERPRRSSCTCRPGPIFRSRNPGFRCHVLMLTSGKKLKKKQQPIRRRQDAVSCPVGPVPALWVLRSPLLAPEPELSVRAGVYRSRNKTPARSSPPPVQRPWRGRTSGVTSALSPEHRAGAADRLPPLQPSLPTRVCFVTCTQLAFHTSGAPVPSPAGDGVSQYQCPES